MSTNPQNTGLPPSPLQHCSLADVQNSFEQQRIRFTGGQRRGIIKDFDRLRNRVQELQKITENFLKQAWLTDSELQTLKPLLTSTKPILHQLDVELSRIDSTETDLVPVRLLEEVLVDAEPFVVRVQQQLRLVDEVLETADLLHHIVEELIQTTETCPARLQNLARRISVRGERNQELHSLLPLPGISLSRLIPSHGRESEPTIFTHSIQTARTLAWSLQGNLHWRDHLETLVIGALLQDVGMFAFELIHNVSANQLKTERPDAYRLHPSLGSSLAAGIEGFEVKLPPLISQHHERLDGTGFPRGLRAKNIHRPARMLAVAGRFTELWESTSRELSPDSSINESMVKTVVSVTRQLLREAEHAELDQSCVEIFIHRIDPQLLSYLESLEIDGQPAAFIFDRIPGVRLDKTHSDLKPSFSRIDSVVRERNSQSIL